MVGHKMRRRVSLTIRALRHHRDPVTYYMHGVNSVESEEQHDHSLADWECKQKQ